MSNRCFEPASDLLSFIPHYYCGTSNATLSTFRGGGEWVGLWVSGQHEWAGLLVSGGEWEGLWVSGCVSGTGFGCLVA